MTVTKKSHTRKAARRTYTGKHLRDRFARLRSRLRPGERFWRGLLRFWRNNSVRHTGYFLGAVAAGIGIAVLALWWRLNSGPIEVDLATPWLTSAIQDNFGKQHTVTIGGTQIERDEKGRTSIRIRDIVVRDADGTVVASAPKAEVGISGSSLLTGHIRAESLNLVGAEMAVRIEQDGKITVFTGTDKRPIATAEPTTQFAPSPQTSAPATDNPLSKGLAGFAGMMAWIDRLGATGLDGHDLRELGLKNGNLIVDDRRNGKRWTFSNINLSLTRPEQGGILFRVASENPEHPWVLSAAMRPLSGGIRAIGVEARKVSVRDLLLALRMDAGEVDTDLAVSASLRAEIGADGMPQTAEGEIASSGGYIADPKTPAVRVNVSHADVRFNWDPLHHALIAPFQIQSDGNQFTLLTTLQAPADHSGVWSLSIARGDPVIDPVIIGGSGQGDDASFAFNRVSGRVRIDTVKQRIEVEQADFNRVDVRPSHNIGVAISGSYDYSDSVPHLAFGVAGNRMSVSLLKRLWPVFIAVNVRTWVEEHVSAGTVERVVIAGNAPLPDFQTSGPPLPTEGLSVDVETSGTTLRPIPDLPAIHDADLTVRVTGGSASVSLGRGTVQVSPTHKLNIANGLFEVPNTHPKGAPADVSFRIDGSVPAAAELLASDGLRGAVNIPVDPSTSRGTVSAQVKLNLKLGRDALGPVAYAVNADLTNFAADKMLMGQKVEASSLHVAATSQGYQVKGNVKVNGTPGTLDFHKSKDEALADLRLETSLDEAARGRLHIDFGGAVIGAIPVVVTGRIGNDDKADQIDVNADLTPVKIDNLLPGWVKPAGKRARMTFRLVKSDQSIGLDNLVIEGSGALAKGSVELDSSGNVVSANFPTYSMSSGDKVSLKADRGADKVLRVVIRGDVYDGRDFIKSALASTPQKTKTKSFDLDLDIKVGAVAGYNGEALRGLDFKLSRRSGRIRTFLLNARIGRDAPLNGDLRLRARDNHQVIYIETDDAGALFRFTDMYPRMAGGQMWMAMDPPTSEETPQVGILSIRNFSVQGEAALERAVAGKNGNTRGRVEFTELRAEFTKYPGRMTVRDGVLRGPLVGATIDGQIDYVHNNVRAHGTFVPFYGINNMFGQIPIVGIFLGGGSNEGLFGITYEASGPPSSPHVVVNPISAVAPGLLRKFFPVPGSAGESSYAQPTR
ncbi:MAG TPA: DUF3971 domain-containing protein [Pseudolabrys sp.]|nr:DUF3971 domain-containing protein [Pseudolabrys sp.]